LTTLLPGAKPKPTNFIMKKLFFLSVLSLLFLAPYKANTQVVFDVPVDYKLDKPKDYDQYEDEVILASKWLEETDLDKETEKRKEVNGFVLNWVQGSPKVSVMLSEKLMEIIKKNEQLLIIYMGSFTRYKLERKDDTSDFNATKYAVQSLIAIYKKGIEMKKNKDMAELLKYDEEGRLNEYLIQVLKVKKD
jgi:hypothetical protein